MNENKLSASLTKTTINNQLTQAKIPLSGVYETGFTVSNSNTSFFFAIITFQKTRQAYFRGSLNGSHNGSQRPPVLKECFTKIPVKNQITWRRKASQTSPTWKLTTENSSRISSALNYRFFPNLKASHSFLVSHLSFLDPEKYYQTFAYYLPFTKDFFVLLYLPLYFPLLP